MRRHILFIFIILTNFGYSIEIATKAKAYKKHKVIYNNNILKSGGDLNWRTNNPGNLKIGEFAWKYGAIGSFKGFAIFPTMRDGFLAQLKLLTIDKYRSQKVSKFIEIYSPKKDGNNVIKYKSFLKKNLPKIQNKKLHELTKSEKRHLVWVIALYEGFHEGDTYKVYIKKRD